MLMPDGSYHHCDNAKSTADHTLQSARNLMELGEFELAAKLVSDVLESRQHDGRLWELKGLIHHSLGESQQSVRAIERASLLIPLSPASRVCLGHEYANIGKRELSRDLLVELIDDESLSVDLLLQVATGLDGLGHPDLAIKTCRVAMQRDPQAAQAYYDMGYYSARCAIPVHITESLMRKAIYLDPECTNYRVGLATLLIEMGRTGDAHNLVKNFTNEQIAQLNCQCCLNRITELFESVGDYRRSIVCRERTLALELRGGQSDCE